MPVSSPPPCGLGAARERMAKERAKAVFINIIVPTASYFGRITERFKG
jgi:hypothetical protein